MYVVLLSWRITRDISLRIANRASSRYAIVSGCLPAYVAHETRNDRDGSLKLDCVAGLRDRDWTRVGTWLCDVPGDFETQNEWMSNAVPIRSGHKVPAFRIQIIFGVAVVVCYGRKLFVADQILMRLLQKNLPLISNRAEHSGMTTYKRCWLRAVAIVVDCSCGRTLDDAWKEASEPLRGTWGGCPRGPWWRSILRGFSENPRSFRGHAAGIPQPPDVSYGEREL